MKFASLDQGQPGEMDEHQPGRKAEISVMCCRSSSAEAHVTHMQRVRPSNGKDEGEEEGQMV